MKRRGFFGTVAAALGFSAIAKPKEKPADLSDLEFETFTMFESAAPDKKPDLKVFTRFVDASIKDVATADGTIAAVDSLVTHSRRPRER